MRMLNRTSRSYSSVQVKQEPLDDTPVAGSSNTQSDPLFSHGVKCIKQEPLDDGYSVKTEINKTLKQAEIKQEIYKHMKQDFSQFIPSIKQEPDSQTNSSTRLLKLEPDFSRHSDRIRVHISPIRAPRDSQIKRDSDDSGEVRGNIDFSNAVRSDNQRSSYVPHHNHRPVYQVKRLSGYHRITFFARADYIHHIFQPFMDHRACIADIRRLAFPERGYFRSRRYAF